MSVNNDTTVPSPTVTPAEAPERPDLTAGYPDNYEICDRTGFKVRVGTLVEEWNGAKVRPESFESRHPQDFVRSVPENLTGSPRPEQQDLFIGEDVYPNGVSPDDL